MTLTYMSVSRQQLDTMLDELRTQAEVTASGPVAGLPTWNVNKTLGFITLAHAIINYDVSAQVLSVNVLKDPPRKSTPAF